jgi:hypothetical protein
MTNPQYPQNRSVWNVTDLEPGEWGRLDEGQMSRNLKVAAGETIKFGAFLSKDSSGNAEAIAVAETRVYGVSLISQIATDYGNRQYSENEQIGVAKRGYVVVGIDTDNKPSAGGVIRISYGAGIIGYLTSVTTNAIQIADTEGVEIIAVGDEVALVYLDGKPAHVSAAAA